MAGFICVGAETGVSVEPIHDIHVVNFVFVAACFDASYETNLVSIVSVETFFVGLFHGCRLCFSDLEIVLGDSADCFRAVSVLRSLAFV